MDTKISDEWALKEAVAVVDPISVEVGSGLGIPWVVED